MIDAFLLVVDIVSMLVLLWWAMGQERSARRGTKPGARSRPLH